MKKFFSILVICSLLFSSIVCAEALPTSFENKAALDQYFNHTIDYNQNKMKAREIYLFNSYSKSSKDGFKSIVTKDGKRYKMRVRSAQFDLANGGPITNMTHILTVPAGKTITNETTKTITSKTATFVKGSASISLAQPILKLINATVNIESGHSEERTETYSVKRGTAYSFPTQPKYQNYDYVKYYIGFDYDHYNLVIDYVPSVEFNQLKKVVDVIEIPGKIDPTDDRIIYDGELIFVLEDGTRERFSIDGYYPREDIEYIYDNYTTTKDGKLYYKCKWTEWDYNSMITEYATYKIPVPIEFPVGVNILE
ncbi:hypothetical protein [Wukongibacter sp. M2B1]|uniref:hypothetical protein n=1 Tax=Wukongibacter sp. M2B1 TaxID=3088895 RepID=UPI003D7B05A2